MDMTKYLGLFKGKIALEKQAVYKSQIKNYTSFVRRLVSTNKILSRSFYIVLPYRASETTDLGIINEQLKLNCDIVAKGLGRLGIRVRRLSSVEILDLFYSFYNPEQAKLRSVSDQTLRLLEAACI